MLQRHLKSMRVVKSLRDDLVNREQVIKNVGAIIGLIEMKASGDSPAAKQLK